MMEEQTCHETRLERPFEQDAFREAEKTVLMVSGMGCPNCATRVRNGLLNVEGVVWTEVDLAGRCAYVAFNDRTVSLERLLERINEIGRSSNHHYSAVPAGTF